MENLTTIRGQLELQFLPRCAALVQYGGGDDMRQAEALVSIPLAASAIPSKLKAAISDAVDEALARRSTYDPLTASHLPATWNREECSWEAAVAVSTEPNEGSGWANIYFHGWLYGGLIAEKGADLYSAQRFPLIGIWEPTEGVAPFGHNDVQAAGSCALQPADQHIHKVDAYAGGDRESTIALYMESGYDRETAEAAMIASESECSQFHVGADMARIAVNACATGSVTWAVCVDLEPGFDPRVHVTLLLVVPGGGTAASFFRKWSPSSSDEMAVQAARTDLSCALEAAGVTHLAAERLRGVLLA